MSHKSYDTETKEEAVRRYERGDNIQAIVAELDIRSSSTVISWAKKAGVSLRHKAGVRKLKKAPLLTLAAQPRPTWEQIKLAVLDAFEQAARVPGLEDKINRLENVVACQRNEILTSRAADTKATEEAQRYRLAIQQGEVAAVK